MNGDPPLPSEPERADSAPEFVSVGTSHNTSSGQAGLAGAAPAGDERV